MARLLIFAIAAFISTASIAASPFDALHNVETKNRQAAEVQQRELDARRAAEQERAQAQAAAQSERYAQAQRAEQARAAKARAGQEARNAQALARAQAKEDVAQAKAERIEAEDRALLLEEKRLSLQVLKAKADRTDDYIDADLKNQAAHTDVVQSNADTARDISSGIKDVMQKSGDAAVNESERLF